MSEAADPVPEPKTRVHRTRSQTWTKVLVGFGLALTVIWVLFLGLALFKIMEFAI
jgi:hypothetical protein